MDSLPQILSVFGIAFLSFWASIPAGLALGLSPVVVAVTAMVSYASGVALVALVGGRIQAWVYDRFGSKIVGDPGSPVRKVWDRFGIVGLALLAPITTGSQIGAAVGLALNAPPRRLFVFMALGAIVWGVALTAAVSLGVLGIRSVMTTPMP